MAASCPWDGDRRASSGCPGHVGALGSFAHLCPLFWCPRWHQLFHLIPPKQRNPCPWFPTSLSHLSGAFPLGLVWCFSEHRVVCSTQRPPCCMFSPSPGCQGVCAPFPTASGGGRSPVHPPNAPKCNFTGGLKGMRPENKSRRKRVQDGPVCAASWASCAFEGRDLGQDSPQKHQMRGARDESWGQVGSHRLPGCCCCSLPCSPPPAPAAAPPGRGAAPQFL